MLRNSASRLCSETGEYSTVFRFRCRTNRFIIRFNSFLKIPDIDGVVNEDLPNSWECPPCCKEGKNIEYKVGLAAIFYFDSVLSAIFTDLFCFQPRHFRARQKSSDMRKCSVSSDTSCRRALENNGNTDDVNNVVKSHDYSDLICCDAFSLCPTIRAYGRVVVLRRLVLIVSEYNTLE